MKIVYIAHPISGDVEGNIKKILAIIREINLTMPDVIPIAPYIVECQALDDNNPEERKRGIANNFQYFRRRIMDEVWLYGPRISSGMSDEWDLCEIYNIPVWSKSKETYYDWFQRMVKDIPAEAFGPA
jgi:hypothetical protein